MVAKSEINQTNTAKILTIQH